MVSMFENKSGVKNIDDNDNSGNILIIVLIIVTR